MYEASNLDVFFMEEGGNLMKKNFKYLLFLLLAMVVSPIFNVKAQTYSAQFNDKYMWIPNTWVNKAEPSGRIHYQQLTMITRKSDNQFVYCIEPGTPLDPNTTYTGQDYDQSYVSNMTQAQWRRIQLLAYYGYGYSDSEVNHTDLKWYSVTQFMIWQTVPSGMDIYFTDSLNGNRITKYTSEMAEMEALLNKHYTTPDFGNSSYQMVIGNTLKLTDKNGVLSKYAVNDNSFVNTSKDGNDLYITAKNVGNTTLTLTKRDVKYSHPTIVYVKAGTQNIVEVGSYDPIDNSININIVGGKIAFHKLDKDTGLSTPQGEATLKGAVYGIYREDGTKVGEVTTDANGYAKSDYLPNLGRFYLQEITPSKGYELDTNKYYFEIKVENLEPTIQVQEKVIEREYQITKVVASDKTQIMTPEPNVKFGIYDKDNKLVKTLTTDSEGKITFTLPYGKYVLRQLTTPSGFEKIKDYNFEITESGPRINKVFSNAEITARIKVVKVDQDGKIITRAGIKFKIKDLSTGKYVCQTVAYPNHKTYCEFETDENGMLITPYPLNSGNYQLEEIDQRIEGYVWNSEPLKFSINENSKIESTEDFDAIMEIRFTNQEVKGKLEVQKKGEKVVIEDGKFSYEDIPLPNVTFGLYDEEGNLVGEYTTDENGYLKVEDLKLGKYTLKELKTVDGYVLDGKVYEFELVYKDQYTPVITKSYTLKNYLEKSDLEFTKSDLTTGEGIKDTKIEIYTEDDELVFSGVTDEEGKIVVKDLFVGRFYIIESEAATGYRLSDEKVYFEITENGKIVKANMTNEKITSKVKLHKVDEEGKALAGVTIGVYDVDGNLLGSYVTDENGDIEVELEYGSYYFQEIATVDGYVLSDEKVYFDVTTDGEIIQKTLVNELEEIEVPNTSSNSYIDIIAGIIVLAGASVIVISTRKKNKK